MGTKYWLLCIAAIMLLLTATSTAIQPNTIRASSQIRVLCGCTESDEKGDYFISSVPTHDNYFVTLPRHHEYGCWRIYDPVIESVNPPVGGINKKITGWSRLEELHQGDSCASNPPTPQPPLSGKKIPVVLVHGWNGIKLCTGTHAKPSTDPADYERNDGYFHTLGDDLQAGNSPYKVFYARLETDACYTPHADQNVSYLKRTIDYAKQKTGANKVILIAHSMGGIVARAYVEDPAANKDNDVSTLFTFGSPHRGVDITANSKLYLLWAQKGLISEKEFFQNQLFVCDAREAYMDGIFNKRYKQNSSVTYYLISGNAPDDRLTDLGKQASQSFGAIANDGFIPTQSGLGLPGTMFRLTTKDVHSSGEGPISLGSIDYFTKGSGGYNCLTDALLRGNTDSCGAKSTIPPISAPPGSTYTCGGEGIFPQTGYRVSQAFWALWSGGKSSGNLAHYSMMLANSNSEDALAAQTTRSYEDSLYINGYPITEERSEISLTDGKAYATQWFERARFEYHPENQPPYNVLLGLLGVSAVKSRQNEAPFRPVGNPGGGAIWFADTQHTLGDSSEGGQAITAYWNRLGGLQQFGYPLSQPFMEKNSADGKTYLVQYFERQRFEYHPEHKGTRYEVLLGRLGAEQYSVNPPSNGGQAQATPTSKASRVLYGPVSKELTIRNGGGSEATGVRVKDFVAQVTIINPHNLEDRDIVYSLASIAPSSSFSVHIGKGRSGATWDCSSYQNGEWKILVSGGVPQIQTMLGAPNTLTVSAKNSAVTVKLNGLDLGKCSLPSNTEAGEIFFLATVSPSDRLRIQDFTIWSADN
jgi:pimeloyl-ACP methyl ester carboxylesterase